MSLITRCPQCQSAFSVNAQDLRAFEGLVRCGHCQHIFDGFECLDVQLPTLTQRVDSESNALINPVHDVAPPSAAPLSTPNSARTTPLPIQVIRSRQQSSATWTPPSVDQNQEPDFELPEPSLEPHTGYDADPEPFRLSGTRETAPEPLMTVMGESRLRGNTPSEFGRDVPSFMVTGPTPSSAARFLWRFAALLALLLAFAQGVYLYRNDIAAQWPSLRPVLERACQALGCDVQFPRQAQRISVQASSLQQEPNALSADDTATFKLRFALQNRFNRPQAWPHLLVLLTDSSGAVVVRKVMPPTDYVPRRLIDTPFKPQQEEHFVVDMQVKGLSISGFEIDKFFP